MARVTVVNNNPEFLELMEAILEDERFETTTVEGDDPDAIEQIIDSRPDVLIIDLRLGAGRLHGWDVAQEVRATPTLDGLPILICSADVVALAELQDDLAERPRVMTLQKPFSIDELTAKLEALVPSA